MSETKFKVGDRVRCKSNSGICCDDVFIREGQILKIESDETCFRTYDVSFISNVTARVHYDDMELVSRSSDDPKTAFLTELKALLEKYDIVICGSPSENIFILVGENKIKYSDSYLISSNIFDYDKGEQPLP